MKQVTLKPLLHHEQECIGIYFNHNSAINETIRKNAKAKWSQTNKCWYVLLSRENYNKLLFALKGIAEINQEALHQYLAEKKNKAISTKPAFPKTSSPVQLTNNKVLVQHESVQNNDQIHSVNTHVLPVMKQQLKLKAYSPSTIKTYINEMAQLLQTIKNIPADELTPEHLKKYLVYCYEKMHLKENTLHSRINAMKFYYEQVLRREKFFWEIPRPKKQNLLPRIFNQDEIASIINSVTNKKHKTMLMLSYSAGLRVSEVVALKTYNIDSKRMTIFINQAKGKKD